MILVAIGSNLSSPIFGSPLEVCEAAIAAMDGAGLRVLRCSHWYETSPVPPSDQPLYVNGVALIATDRSAATILEILLALEIEMGRQRGEPNAARIIDLDLLHAHGLVLPGPGAPILPHPRMHTRAFVMRPLLDVAPAWRHPITGHDARWYLERAEDRLGIRRIPASRVHRSTRGLMVAEHSM